MTTPHNLPAHDRIRVTAPAAGANWSFTNTDGGILILRAVTFLFTTSAVAANRIVGLKVTTDQDTWLNTSTGLAQIASLAVPYSAFAGSESAAISTAGVALPWRDDGVLIGRGDTIASVTAAIDVGDQYSAIVMDVLRYLPDYPYAAQPYREGYNMNVGE